MKEVLYSMFFLVLAGLVLWGWNYWYGKQQALSDTRPSIATLSSEPIAVSMNPVSVVKQESKNEKEEQSKEEKKVDAGDSGASNVHDKATLEINILNGGAVKGSAGKAQDLLKKNGYVKSEAATAKGDYTGTTLYYKDSFEKDAQEIQKILGSDTSVTMKAAPTTTSELSSASVVVVLGK